VGFGAEVAPEVMAGSEAGDEAGMARWGKGAKEAGESGRSREVWVAARARAEAGGGTGGMGGRGGGKGCENVPPPHSQQKFVGCKSIQVYFSHASEGESAEPNHSQRLKPTAHC